MIGGGGRRLVLVRHGRTAWNHVGRAQGHADIELDEVGHAQAAAMAAYLSGAGAVSLHSSDLSRARQTAAYLEKETGLVATLDPRLREFDVGERQGLDLDEFREAFPAAYAEWLAGNGVPYVAGAETDDDVLGRTLPALREVLAALPAGEAGLVVTHGAAIKVALLGLLGWPQGLATTLQGLDNCAWATVEELEPGGRLRLAGYNEQVATTLAAQGSTRGQA